MLKNFRFLKPVLQKEDDQVIEVDEDIELEPEYLICEDMNEIEAKEIEAMEEQ
jgi:hypothetical protein